MLPQDNKAVTMPLEHPASVKDEDQGEDEMNPKEVGVAHIRLTKGTHEVMKQSSQKPPGLLLLPTIVSFMNDEGFMA